MSGLLQTRFRFANWYVPQILPCNDLRNQIDKRVKFATDSGCPQSIVCNKALLLDMSKIVH
jgi:hypothetical protein